MKTVGHTTLTKMNLKNLIVNIMGKFSNIYSFKYSDEITMRRIMAVQYH